MGGVGLADQGKLELVGPLNVGWLVFLIPKEDSPIEGGLALTAVVFSWLLTGEYLFLILTQLFLRRNSLNIFPKHSILLHLAFGRLYFSVLVSFLIASWVHRDYRLAFSSCKRPSLLIL